ncbi:uncharacterized protein V6R79_002990 [Siganus canaliculatus]
MASRLCLAVLLCVSCVLELGAAMDLPMPMPCVPMLEKCPEGWSQYGDRCYVFQKAAKDWVDAERFCISIGGNLAPILSPIEYGFMRDLVKKATGAHKTTWVGGYTVAKRVWMWSDGTAFEFEDWHQGEPNNFAKRENCMEINFRELG